MIEASGVGLRGIADTRLLIQFGRCGSRVLTVGSADEVSSASPSIQTCTASWRPVSRSMGTITPPQAGHGGKDTPVDVSAMEATGTCRGFAPSACRQRGSASVRQRAAKKP